MLFAIIATDHADTLKRRQKARPAHLARLQRLRDEGRLVLAGPFPAVECDDPGSTGFSGSLVVAEFPSLAEARRWADQDPYVEAGIYRNVTIKPFHKVMP
ncbi:MAG TPA: YciI family protein [Gammaproteobacteria bacterium]|nr:YciI family protein [Gammaproteobacteria bacterium]